ncbi:DUF3892 domain-containing protein [Sphingomonas sp. ZB1N12]|uniref:DUF3892 domain-containing protein n=1 Tax=Sphingomonas arabinosi TaxID=3096160 RepID=UPI002FCA173C
MAKRCVQATVKNTQGEIAKLRHFGEFWSSRSKADAIADIHAGTHEYWVNWTNAPETKIKVVSGSTGKYLRTDRDTTTCNNLDDLPGC